jgi:hypothetical protein
MLIQRGAKVHNNALLWAISSGYTTAIKYVRDHGVSPIGLEIQVLNELTDASVGKICIYLFEEIFKGLSIHENDDTILKELVRMSQKDTVMYLLDKESNYHNVDRDLLELANSVEDRELVEYFTRRIAMKN